MDGNIKLNQDCTVDIQQTNSSGSTCLNGVLVLPDDVYCKVPIIYAAALIIAVETYCNSDATFSILFAPHSLRDSKAALEYVKRQSGGERDAIMAIWDIADIYNYYATHEYNANEGGYVQPITSLWYYSGFADRVSNDSMFKVYFGELLSAYDWRIQTARETYPRNLLENILSAEICLLTEETAVEDEYPLPIFRFADMLRHTFKHMNLAVSTIDVKYRFAERMNNSSIVSRSNFAIMTLSTFVPTNVVLTLFAPEGKDILVIRYARKNCRTIIGFYGVIWDGSMMSFKLLDIGDIIYSMEWKYIQEIKDCSGAVYIIDDDRECKKLADICDDHNAQILDKIQDN